MSAGRLAWHGALCDRKPYSLQLTVDGRPAAGRHQEPGCPTYSSTRYAQRSHERPRWPNEYERLGQDLDDADDVPPVLLAPRVNLVAEPLLVLIGLDVNRPHVEAVVLAVRDLLESRHPRCVEFFERRQQGFQLTGRPAPRRPAPRPITGPKRVSSSRDSSSAGPVGSRELSD